MCQCPKHKELKELDCCANCEDGGDIDVNHREIYCNIRKENTHLWDYCLEYRGGGGG